MKKINDFCNIFLIVLVLGSMNIGGVIDGSLINLQSNNSSNSGNMIESISNHTILNSKINSIVSYQTQLPLESNQKSWIELGPKPIYNPSDKLTGMGPVVSGRISSIAINQSNPNIIYAGAALGGVWKTTDGGQSWVPLMDNLQNLAVGSITISSDSKTIFVGTGEANHAYDSYYGYGLLKSSDEGRTWQNLGADVFKNSSISGIVINSTNPNIITVSSTFGSCCKGLNINYNSNGVGIFYSTNGGQTWTKTNINGVVNSSYSGVAQLLADPTNNSNLYATGFHGELWFSQNGGQSWSNITISNSLVNPQRSAITISKNDPNLLFIAMTDSASNLALMYMYNKSSDTYTLLNGMPPGNPCNSQCWYNMIMAVDPVNTNILYFGGATLFKSIDQGYTWTTISINSSVSQGIMHGNFHAFEFYPGNPNRIFVGTDGGIYSSIYSGSSWTNLNSNLEITPFTSIAASPTNDSFIIGGTQSTGCVQYANNTYWTITHGGDGGSALFFDNSQIICNQANLGIDHSFDGGSTWLKSSNSGISSSDKHLFYPPMAQEYLNRSIVYIGTDHLYKSTDFGVSWNVINSLQNPGIITSIALSTSNHNVIAVGDENGTVLLTTDGGQVWSTILNSTNVLKSAIIHHPISSIAIDPLNSAHIFVSLAVNGIAELLETKNSGGSWQIIQNLGQIPTDVPINILKYNPITKTLFIGTDSGLYYYNGTGYYALGSGLPNSSVWDLTFTHSNYLLAATHGRGAWINYLSPEIFLNGVTNDTATSVGAKFTVTVTDPNGLNQTFINWNYGANKSILALTTLTIPNNDSDLTLKIFAQDPTGNWVIQSFIFNPRTSQGFLPTVNNKNSLLSNNQAFNSSVTQFLSITFVIIALGAMAIILIKRRSK